MLILRILEVSIPIPSPILIIKFAEMSSNSNAISSIDGKDIDKDKLTKNLTDKYVMEEDDDEIVLVEHWYRLRDGTPHINYTHAKENIIPNNTDVNVTLTHPPSHGGSVSHNAFNNYLAVPFSATSNASESTRANSSFTPPRDPVVSSQDQQEHKPTRLGRPHLASYSTTATDSFLSNSRDAPSPCDICTRIALKSNTEP
ncbi:hypothetical protein M422DRAFT_53352 [Sphaerobolus stellatus SS14]|uniref:Uncharacterized protein n=1 Tax=Sphaerobolus stellatus (strain SS14) TaxID=990650 RepID=A0A0C9V1U0_SPHS4|nr:hypothetical protein M422DRAFT_53352 [Sphaerobolus stellatus SS14]